MSFLYKVKDFTFFQSENNDRVSSSASGTNGSSSSSFQTVSKDDLALSNDSNTNNDKITISSNGNIILPSFPLPESTMNIIKDYSTGSKTMVDNSNNFNSSIPSIQSLLTTSARSMLGSLAKRILPSINLEQDNIPRPGSFRTISNETFHHPKIAIIGIHGWFPGKLLQRVVGIPTGSDRYVQRMITVLRQYYKDKHKITIQNENILSIPLEGEGKMMDRVDSFMKEIHQNYCSVSEKVPFTLSSCDDIYVVAHSQGAPVAILLLDKLVANGILSLQHPKRITLLSMAGIWHGPFPELGRSVIVQYIEAESSRELFELNETLLIEEVDELIQTTIPKEDSSSNNTLHGPLPRDGKPPISPELQRLTLKRQQLKLSHRLRSATIRLLKKGIRIVAIGSWMDQVVPIYSATMHGFYHPNILRAVFVQNSHYENDFLTRLVTFALDLRNSGLSDQGLLLYLSEFIAGSLINDTSHSAIYEDNQVFMLAIDWNLTSFEMNCHPLLSMTSKIHENIHDMESKSIYMPFSVPPKPNHYYLPWILHSLFTDPDIRSYPYFRNQLEQLHTLYMNWSPDTKVLKELKWKLDPLRTLSKL